MTTVIADGVAAPADPVGMAVADVLVELLDGLVVELSYARPPDIQHRFSYNDLTQTAIADRAGPGDWQTTIVVNIAGGVAALCAADDTPNRLPELFAELPLAAFRAADSIGRSSGVDGHEVTAPIHRALQDSVIIEIIAGELARLSGDSSLAAGHRELITQIIAEFERIGSTTVEGDALSHGVVVRPGSDPTATAHRYPEHYRQKRVPLLFDGRNSVLVIDADGHAVHEVQRSRPERSLDTAQQQSLHEFIARFGDLDGSLVAAASRVYGALGFYAHADRSIWVTSEGSPFLVKRGVQWRAVPTAALSTGIGQMIGSPETGRNVAEAAVLLSLHGHGGIIAVVSSPDDIEGVVRSKDRVDRVLLGTAEQPVHDVLDVAGLDAATLLRLAAIDGATVVDQRGVLLAYGAVVTSNDSEGEGARTAAAKSLSRSALLVVRVSEDGPVTIFIGGEVAGRLLA